MTGFVARFAGPRAGSRRAWPDGLAGTRAVGMKRKGG